jgi:tetratricopeptide (TPR) repeat protein
MSLLLLGAALLCHANRAWAQTAPDDAETRRAARQLAEEGGQLYDEGKYADAVDRLRRAYELVPAPTIAVLEAQALIRLGRLVDAAERYEEAIRFPLGPDAGDAFRQAAQDARAALDKLQARIPQLVVVVRGATRDTAGLEVTVDGKPMPLALLGVRRPTDPGRHRVVASLPGALSHAVQITLAEGEQRQVILIPAAAAPEPEGKPAGVSQAEAPASGGGTTQRTMSYVAFGVGGVGLATGVFAGAVMLSKKATLDEQCSKQAGQMVCGAAQQETLDAFHSWKTVSWVGYGVGLAGAGVGLVLLLLAPSEPESADRAGITPWVGLSEAGIRARF